MSQKFRLDNVGMINRDKKISFKFNGKKYRVTQIQLYKDGKVWREISNAIDADQNNC